MTDLVFYVCIHPKLECSLDPRAFRIVAESDLSAISQALEYVTIQGIEIARITCREVVGGSTVNYDKLHPYRYDEYLERNL